MHKADEALVRPHPLRWPQVLLEVVPAQEAPSTEVRRVLVQNNLSEVPCAIRSNWAAPSEGQRRAPHRFAAEGQRRAPHCLVGLTTHPEPTQTPDRRFRVATSEA